MSGLINWFDERYGLRQLAEENLYRPIPKRLSWFGCLGGLSLTAFIIQVGTGIFLMCFYIPSVSEAFGSVQYIKHSVTYGWLIQKLHFVGSQMMVGCILGHMLRVLFKGIYKRPRELHWVSGASLLMLALLIAYTGTLLPAEKLYVWNVRHNGEGQASPTMVTEYDAGTMPDGRRFSTHRLSFVYAVHVALIPLVMATFMGFHFSMVRRTGISETL